MLKASKTIGEYSLNEFAVRCFRDTADRDYIAARMAHRAQLYPQFLWSGLQAVEKYLKYILLCNRIKASDVRHNLGLGLRRVEEGAPFPMSLSPETRSFIEYLDTFGRFRYFETMYHYEGDELMRLDRAVWEIRRYCQPINETATKSDGTKRSLLEANLRMIERAEDSPPQRFRVAGGELEKIIANGKHPARERLVWNNLYFGSRIRHTVRIQRRYGFSNSPLARHPEMIDEVLRYVYLPKDVVSAFKEESKRRSRRIAGSSGGR